MKNYDVLNELVPKTQELHREIFDKGYEQGQKDILEQQPCEDAVSRHDALNCVTSNEFRYRIVEDIKALPSVTPKEKSECEHDHEVVKAYNDGQAYILDKIRAEIDDAKMPKNQMSFFRDGINCALEIIDKYRGDGWHTEPPEESGEYYATWTSDDRKRAVGICEYEIDESVPDGMWWPETYMKSYPGWKVVAWMPLPEPYKEANATRWQETYIGTVHRMSLQGGVSSDLFPGTVI